MLSILIAPDSFERLHCPSMPLVDHCDGLDLCCRVQLKLSACFSSSSPIMVPYSYVAESVHLRRNAVNSYLHLCIAHDRRLWRHPMSIEVQEYLVVGGEYFISLMTACDADSASLNMAHCFSMLLAVRFNVCGIQHVVRLPVILAPV